MKHQIHKYTNLEKNVVSNEQCSKISQEKYPELSLLRDFPVLPSSIYMLLMQHDHFSYGDCNHTSREIYPHKGYMYMLCHVKLGGVLGSSV